MKSNKVLSNSEILDLLMDKSGCENDNQLAAYLTEKYGKKIDRKQVYQFRDSTSLTITSLLLREALE